MSDDTQQQCPKCESPYGYTDGQIWTCPECFHEWTLEEVAAEAAAAGFFDVNGNELKDGDAVTVVKDLKAGGSTIKSGTKVKKIRLLDDPVNGHDISCKIDGHGQMYLKCSVVKKA